MPERFLLTVGFKVEPVQIEVEGTSLADVWERRFDLAAAAQPESYEVEPLGVEGSDDGD